ncbi:MAG: exodeoxyribonuclease III [Candidatus Yonathbacteria bacterium]|nr:exodeoxyribonuclease III [Candidatus Yonathbacteria bacterium]
MKLISWNVNGIRAVERKKLLRPFFAVHNADIVCLQETKARPEQVAEEVGTIDGYHAYFNAPYEKNGYSGVALFSKKEPEKVWYGMNDERYDTEGRFIAADFGDFIIFNVYFPNGGGGPERLAYKLDFYDAFLEYVEKIKRQQNTRIVICGDVNTAHEAIDLARPKENEKNTGFLPEERAWIDELIAAGYTDTFRHFYPEKVGAYTYWDMKTRARDRNVGWRLDYFFVSSALLPSLVSTDILAGTLGSDHCPIAINLDIR